METDYRIKIQKLLALAESPNEHEAKAALLKARELMARYKLTEQKINNVSRKMVKNICTNIVCSKRKNPWIVGLSAIIGENYCCRSYCEHVYRKQTRNIEFIGLADDVEICAAIFEYAVDCVLSKIKCIRKENKGNDSIYVRQICDSYGYGFTAGIKKAFEKQEEENKSSWGLVLVTPQEVLEAVQNWKEETFSANAEEYILAKEYKDGYIYGKEFDPAKRLRSKE